MALGLARSAIELAIDQRVLDFMRLSPRVAVEGHSTRLLRDRP